MQTIFALAVACTLALPQDQTQQAPVEIVKQDSEVDVNGYNFEWVNSNLK